tara:strand:+ start:106 stop:258 length:153 start_codon:yes stop_codon:yes gene_type:complete
MNEDICVECKEDTSAGSGKWVNRFSVDDGWMCEECELKIFEEEEEEENDG